MPKNSQSENFAEWLHKRMVEARLSESEMVEFKSWLVTKSRDNERSVTVFQLIGWLKDRMAVSKIEKGEQAEFFRWLLQRASEHPEIRDEDLKQIRNETN